MEINLEYRPHKHQKKLHDDGHRYLVICAGRRFGKSVFARQHCILNAIYDPGLYWIVNPTYRQGKMIHWRELKAEVPHQMIVGKNEQEMSIDLSNGSRIEIKGADNEDALRGVGLKGIVMDEAADQKSHVWEEIIRPTLVDAEGWGIFIGTPKGFNWFYELWRRGNKKDKLYDPEWSSYQFTSYDNPYLKKTEIDKAKNEAKRSKREDVFQQEYLAKFKKFYGLIYRTFERKTHVIEPFDFSEYDGWEVYRGLDFGYGVNPTVCLWIAVAPDNKWYIIDEYVETKETDDYHCGMVLSQSGQYPPITLSYADPSNPQKLETWAKNGVYSTKAARTQGTNLKEWVNNGIDIVNEKLKISVMDQKPQLYVFKNCENTIKEFEVYKWKEEKDPLLNKPGRPEKSNDHCFVAGTKVLTKKGWQDIETIFPGNYVWSPLGWSRVRSAGSTGVKKIKDYGVFKCTPDHNILTSGGLKEVDKLGYSDKIMIWANQKPWSLMEFLTGAIQMPKGALIGFIFGALLTKSLRAKRVIYTERFGNTIMAKFQMAIWFTTLTTILGITTLAILSLSLLVNMLKSIIGVFGKVHWRTWRKSESWRQSGINRKLAGEVIALKLKGSGKTESGFQKVVKSVTKFITPLFLVEANIAIKTAKQQPFVDAEVFNLGTEFGCYFANGVLVSNCMDALRYFAVSYRGPQDIEVKQDERDWSFR